MKTKQNITVCRSFRHPTQYIQVFIDAACGDKVFTAEPLIFKEREIFECDGDPSFSMDQNAAQKFMDELWTCGLRPSEGSGSAGALKAVENHLADMKKIVFHALKIKG